MHVHLPPMTSQQPSHENGGVTHAHNGAIAPPFDVLLSCFYTLWSYPTVFSRSCVAIADRDDSKASRAQTSNASTGKTSLLLQWESSFSYETNDFICHTIDNNTDFYTIPVDICFIGFGRVDFGWIPQREDPTECWHSRDTCFSCNTIQSQTRSSVASTL